MAEYIEREALLKHICNSCDGYCECVECDCVNCKSEHRCELVQELSDYPAADVAPVVHGEWIDRSDKGRIYMTHPYVCNLCGRVAMFKEPYCNCGAKMDGERKKDGTQI